MKILNEILLQAALVFFWCGGLLGILVGIGMLFKPDRLMRMNRHFSRWVSTEKMAEQIDRPRWTERFFYRHHRLVGVGLFGGAIVVLYTFLFSYNPRKIAAIIPSAYWRLADAAVGMLLVGSVLAALVGLVVLARPSLLRELEKAANRWISTERLLTLFNGMHHSAEQYILRHHRVAGMAIILGSVYTLIVLSYYLFRGAPRL